jgi:acetyl-CoA carboxylase biotin carboxyl carrier protein
LVKTNAAFSLKQPILTHNPSGDSTVDLKDIKAIIDLMKKNSVAEFEMEKEGFKIRLKRSGGGPVIAYEDAPQIAYASAPVAVAAPQASGAAPAPAAASGVEIKSPMIGTFYRSPSPEAASYVEVGSEVGPDTVVCIIEAMKVMNEIKAEVKGIVTEVLVDNAKPVEFGQPLFRVRPL